MKIISYNVNGIRAAFKKGFDEWFVNEKPDILCIQETKAQPEQIDTAFFEKLGYKAYWYSAQKKGYSGVGIVTKINVDNIETGIGKEPYDSEGRVIRTDIGNISLFSAYFPSGSAGDVRQDIKMAFLDDFYNYLNDFKQDRPDIIVSGDFNICHKPIDIHNPKRLKNTSGFLPEEREWVDKFEDSGFTDSFRVFNKEPDNYSWWSYRGNAKAKNLGWRIDYNWVSNSLATKLKNAAILPDVARHSDHCPVVVELKDESKNRK